MVVEEDTALYCSGDTVMFYDYKNTSILEIELTSYCNAFCGACHRNKNGAELQSYVTLKHIDEYTWNSIIDTKNLENIRMLMFDGNLGDAAMHPNLIPMLNKLSKKRKDLFIKISSNGGLRNTLWWKELAECLSKFERHQVSFSVDGLEDTNHIYRRNVKWNTLINNIKSFNDAGGKSRWRAIIFDHNKHQIKEMENTAKNIGCTHFITFRNRQDVIKVSKYKNKLKEYIITGPSVEDFNNNYKVSKYFKKFDSTKDFTKNTSDIYLCPFGEEGKISIDENGYVWPCCFISTKLEETSSFPVKKYKEFNNINKNSLEKILENFRKDLYPAWENKTYEICNKCLHKYSPPTTH